MLKKFVTIALASGLAAQVLSLLVQRSESRARERAMRDRKQAVQRWEDEGGRVPDAPAATSPAR